MTARLAIVGGVAVWLSSIVYGVLLLGGPLPFMEERPLHLIASGPPNQTRTRGLN